MAWPTALTVDADIIKYVWSQGISRILESGNDYSGLHEGVSTQIKNHIESLGTPDADDVTNTDAFKPAAANLFASLLFQDSHPDLSTRYFIAYQSRMKTTRVELGTGDGARDGGTVARIVVRKRGSVHYTRRHPNTRFPTYRGEGDQ